MNSPLFRPEALREQQTSAFGSTVISTPVEVTVLTAVAFVIAIAISVFLSFGSYSQKSRAIGYLVPDKGLIKISSPQGGVITSSFVHDGQEVQAGDKLYEVSLERSSAEHAQTQAVMLLQLRSQEGSLQRERDQILELAAASEQALQTRIRQTEAELHTRQDRADAAEQTLHRYKELQKKKFVSELQVAQQRNEWLENKANLQALQRDLQTLKDQLPTDQLNAQNKKEQIERELVSIAQQITQFEASRSLVLRAPSDGVVTAITALPGQQVIANATLLTLVPRDATLEAHLLVPTRAIGFIKPGEKVLLRYQAFPFERFGHQEGTVREVARTLLTPAELPPEIPSHEPAYRITVALEHQTINAFGKEAPLQAGMLLEADVLLDKRRLYEWVLEPLYSVTGRL